MPFPAIVKKVAGNNRKIKNSTKPQKRAIMKFDGFPGEKTILSYKLANGVGWLTTHRLIIQKETHNPRLDIMERQDPEMYLLRYFEKAKIKGDSEIHESQRFIFT
jgi:hypothetical protein